MMKRLCVLALAVFAFAPTAIHAATEFSWSAPQALAPGAFGEVTLSARSDESINAVSGTITYDPERLYVVSVTDGGSVIRHWVVPPIARDGRIEFAGIIPGGVGPGFGDALSLVTLTVRGVQEGRTEVALRDADVRLNQPDGRADAVSVPPPAVIVLREGAESEVIASADPAITDALLRVVREPELYDGAWALVFDIRNGLGSLPTVLLRERFLGLPAGDREVVSPARLEDGLRLSILEVRTLDGDFVRRLVPWQLWAAWILAILIVIGGVIWVIKRHHH